MDVLAWLGITILGACVYMLNERIDMNKNMTNIKFRILEDKINRKETK